MGAKFLPISNWVGGSKLCIIISYLTNCYGKLLLMTTIKIYCIFKVYEAIAISKIVIDTSLVNTKWLLQT